MRIAIVDDLAAERALLKDRLEQQLHRRNVQADILEYESGETFLEAARKAPFTAAFLDIYMDGMTGMEAAKNAAENRHGLPAGFYHDLDRPCAGGLSGTGAALSGQALYRRGHRRADGRAACPRTAAGQIYGAKGGGKRDPSALSGHRLRRTLRPLDLRPYDGSKDACHTPTLQDVHRPTKG